MARKILEGEFGPGDTVLVDIKDGVFLFSRENSDIAG
jgi:ATP-dependent Clp protease ATP-binding subunit ClpB